MRNKFEQVFFIFLLFWKGIHNYIISPNLSSYKGITLPRNFRSLSQYIESWEVTLHTQSWQGYLDSLQINLWVQKMNNSEIRTHILEQLLLKDHEFLNWVHHPHLIILLRLVHFSSDFCLNHGWMCFWILVFSRPCIWLKFPCISPLQESKSIGKQPVSVWWVWIPRKYEGVVRWGEKNG